jgi:putative transposase
MAQLQEENLQLKRLVVDLTLDKTMLEDVLAKKQGCLGYWGAGVEHCGYGDLQ